MSVSGSKLIRDMDTHYILGQCSSNYRYCCISLITGSSFHDDPLIKRVPSSLPMGVPMFMKQKDYEFAGSVS